MSTSVACSTRAFWSAILLAPVLAACGGAAPAAAPPPSPSTAPAAPAAPAADDPAVHHAADLALNSLARRKFNTAGCASTDVRVVTETEAAAPPTVSETCTLLVAHRADKTWAVVVRSATQTGNVWAIVTVTPGGEGVVHIDYKP
jgi:hypothetical protein